jgi:hypothetical protein
MTLEEHCRLNDYLFKRCRESGLYVSVRKNVEVRTPDGDAELDLWLVRNFNGHRVDIYGEVKSHYSQRSYNKAIHQFKHAQEILPEYDWRFLLITPNKVERVRLC